MMKRLINRLAMLTTLLAVVVNMSCSKNAAPEPSPAPGNGEIRLSAVITDAVGTKASGSMVDGDEGAKAVLPSIHFLKKDGTALQTNFSGVTAVSGNRDATGAIVFATPPTYAKSDENAWFAAYWPSNTGHGATVTVTPGEKVTWSNIAKTDILLSTQSYDAGKYSAPETGTMTFKHALAQLEVIVKAVPTDIASLAAVQTCWGIITQIGPANIAQNMTYTYATNAVTYDNFVGMYMYKSDYSAIVSSLAIPANTSTTVNAVAMFPPLTGGLLRMKIFTTTFTKGVEVPVQLKDAAGDNCNFEAGKRYTITLTFGADDKPISAKTTIAAWTTGYAAQGNPIWSPTPRVEDYYYTDGTCSRDLIGGKTPEGVVHWVDPTNPKHFKIVSMDEPPAAWEGGTNEAGCLPWATVDEVTGVTDLSDGKLNTLTLMKRDNAAEYKAAKWCFAKNTGLSIPATSVATSDAAYKWYLPATNELQYLFCAYAGIAPTLWTEDEYPPSYDAGFPAGYPEAWNARFTSIFSTENLYWSSGEHTDVRISYGLDFKYGSVGSSLKTSTIGRPRCVREITL